MNHQQSNNPLHGKTLGFIVNTLVEHFGWGELVLCQGYIDRVPGDRINIRCFKNDPSVKSSLKFLRKTQWAGKMVEDLYLAI